MENKNPECGICLSSISSESENYTTRCNHKFHNKCITHWLLLNTNCPICRKELDKHTIASEIKTFDYRFFVIPVTPKQVIYNKIYKHIALIDEMYNNENYYSFNTRLIFRKNNRKEYIFIVVNKINNNKYIIDIYDIDNIYNLSYQIKSKNKINKHHNKNYLRRKTKCKVLSF
jgi:hypothetical protein